MTFSITALDIVASILCLWCLVAIRARHNGHEPVRPPGPTGLPIIGNLLDMPLYQPWITFAEWSKRWGNLMSVSMMGQRLVIINSHKVAMDLLDKRSSLYSDRSQLSSAQQIGYTNILPLMTYGDRFREHRRMLSRVIGSRVLVERFMPLEEASTRSFLLWLLEDPQNFVEHIKKFSGASTLVISHGYTVVGKNAGQDPFVQLVIDAVGDFARATVPGTFLVDTIPALRWIPSWIPGNAGWRRAIQKCRASLDELFNKPHQFVKQRMAEGTALISFTSRSLEDQRTHPGGLDHEEETRWVSVSLVGGGIDTTVSTVHSFFLAMTLFPEVQHKAQAEIDSVIGSDRLPSFQDRDRLPYVYALCNELFRWMPTAPLAIPHRLMEDNTYDGYFLKKGTNVIPNVWAMLHNPETYTNPMDFIPERYLATPTKPAQPDPHTMAFGFGRRMCPGIHLADATIFIAIASLLAVFKVEKAIENGVPITPPILQSSGLISHPVPFKCVVKPRSAAAEVLIRSAAENSEVPTVQL